jgi:hypothetical protein
MRGFVLAGVLLMGCGSANEAQTGTTGHLLDAAADLDSSPEGATGDLAPGANILFVVGTSNGSVPFGGGIGDTFVRARLEAQGHHLTLAPDTTIAEDLLAMSDAADMVLVSESVTSANLLGKLKPSTAPILNYEAFIQDDMGLTALGPPGDPGLPAQFELGVKQADTQIDIVDPTHPLAAGLMGTITVYKAAKEITWGKVAATAEVVATLAGDRAGPCLYVYRKGATLHDGSAAAGLRVGFFLEDDDVTGTPNLMTDDGLRLFDAAVRFTLGR